MGSQSNKISNIDHVGKKNNVVPVDLAYEMKDMMKNSSELK